jgi:hemerythrin-like metal-binding protein
VPDLNTLPLKTNVLVIDDQHEQFFDCIRRLEGAMAAGNGAALVSPLLLELRQYMEMHFKTEERLMKSFDYPLRDMHAIEHRRVRHRLEDLAKHQGDRGDAVRMLDALHHWLETHIAAWDAKLGVHLNERGVT